MLDRVQDYGKITKQEVKGEAGVCPFALLYHVYILWLAFGATYCYRQNSGRDTD